MQWTIKCDQISDIQFNFVKLKKETSWCFLAVFCFTPTLMQHHSRVVTKFKNCGGICDQYAKNWISLEVLLFFFRMFSVKVAGGHTYSSQKKMPSPILSDRSTTVCFKTNPFHLRFVFLCWLALERNWTINVYAILISHESLSEPCNISHKLLFHSF